MSKALKRTLVGLGAFALLWSSMKIVGQLPRSNPVTAGFAGAERGPDPDSITVAMGAITLRIPRNYFVALPDHEGREPSGTAFILLVLLPNLEPRTVATSKELDRTGWHQQMLLAVHYKGYAKSGASLLRTVYRNEMQYTNGRPPTIKPGPFGYRYFKIRAGWMDYLYKGKRTDPSFVLECKPLTDWTLSTTSYSPHCERILPMASDLYADYSYSRKLLPQAQNLDQKVVDLLNKFRIAGPPLKVMQ